MIMNILKQREITAVMVTGRKRGCSNMRQVATDCFLSQTYKNRKLLILDHAEIPFKVPKDDRISHIQIQPGFSIGFMRNLAFDLSESDYLMTWDDDDWYREDRIELQIDALGCSSDKICLLTKFLCVNTEIKEIRRCTKLYGTMPSMCFPRNVGFRFPNLLKGSDVVFHEKFGHKSILIENEPSVYVRSFHGENITPYPFIINDSIPASEEERSLAEIILNKWSAI